MKSRAATNNYPLILAVAAPVLLWPWLPPWDNAILQQGYMAAAIFCIAAAVLEEVLFRGFLQGWLLRDKFCSQPKFGLSRANWLTSLVFAVAHLWQHPAALLPGYFVASLLFGYFRERYRGIRVPLALHVGYNLVLLLKTLQT